MFLPTITLLPMSWMRSSALLATDRFSPLKIISTIYHSTIVSPPESGKALYISWMPLASAMPLA